MNDYFRFIIEAAEKPIVICNTDFRIIYVNEMAKKKYESKLSHKLAGTSVRIYFDEESQTKLDMSVEWFKEDVSNNKVFAFHDDTHNEDVYIKAARDAEGNLIGFYNYIESRKNETGKEYDLD